MRKDFDYDKYYVSHHYDTHNYFEYLYDVCKSTEQIYLFKDMVLLYLRSEKSLKLLKENERRYLYQDKPNKDLFIKYCRQYNFSFLTFCAFRDFMKKNEIKSTMGGSQSKIDERRKQFDVFRDEFISNYYQTPNEILDVVQIMGTDIEYFRYCAKDFMELSPFTHFILKFYMDADVNVRLKFTKGINKFITSQHVEDIFMKCYKNRYLFAKLEKLEDFIKSIGYVNPDLISNNPFEINPDSINTYLDNSDMNEKEYLKLVLNIINWNDDIIVLFLKVIQELDNEFLRLIYNLIICEVLGESNKILTLIKEINDENTNDYLQSIGLKINFQLFKDSDKDNLCDYLNKAITDIDTMHQMNNSNADIINKYTRRDIINYMTNNKYIAVYGTCNSEIRDYGIVSVIIGKREDEEIQRFLTSIGYPFNNSIFIELWNESSSIAYKRFTSKMLDKLVEQSLKKGIDKIYVYELLEVKSILGKYLSMDELIKLGFYHIYNDGEGKIILELDLNKYRND